MSTECSFSPAAYLHLVRALSRGLCSPGCPRSRWRATPRDVALARAHGITIILFFRQFQWFLDENYTFLLQNFQKKIFWNKRSKKNSYFWNPNICVLSQIIRHNVKFFILIDLKFIERWKTVKLSNLIHTKS